MDVTSMIPVEGREDLKEIISWCQGDRDDSDYTVNTLKYLAWLYSPGLYELIREKDDDTTDFGKAWNFFERRPSCLHYYKYRWYEFNGNYWQNVGGSSKPDNELQLFKKYNINFPPGCMKELELKSLACFSNIAINPHVIAFNNCVLDMKMKRVRQGVPEDFCYYSTGINLSLSNPVPISNDLKSWLLKVIHGFASDIYFCSQDTYSLLCSNFGEYCVELPYKALYSTIKVPDIRPLISARIFVVNSSNFRQKTLQKIVRYLNGDRTLYIESYGSLDIRGGILVVEDNNKPSACSGSIWGHLLQECDT